MSNYPPGMSGRDFVRAGIDQPHHHEHQWRPAHQDGFLIEDGAAIFREECRYVEGEYGQGWECEETRTYRFEYDTLEVLGGHEIGLPTIEDWDILDEDVQEVIMEIEKVYVERDDRVEISVDPDRDGGEVAIEFLGYTLCYRPQ